MRPALASPPLWPSPTCSRPFAQSRPPRPRRPPLHIISAPSTGRRFVAISNGARGSLSTRPCRRCRRPPETRSIGTGSSPSKHADTVLPPMPRHICAARPGRKSFSKHTALGRSIANVIEPTARDALLILIDRTSRRNTAHRASDLTDLFVRRPNCLHGETAAAHRDRQMRLRTNVDGGGTITYIERTRGCVWQY